jgi:hypothetical protein
MKFVIALGVLFTSMTVFSQRFPDNKSFGLKSSYNLYFPSFKATNDDATLSNNSNSGFGGGAYFRYDFNLNISFQTELMFASRSGSVSTESVAFPDTAITITQSSVSNITQTSFEIPLYFKARWEIIPRHRGSFKSNAMFGIVTGPRLIFNMASKRSTSSSEETLIYGQQSLEVRDLTSTAASEYFTPFSFGWNVGVDFECLDRLVLFANYYRGFTSMNRKDFGFKSFDNRIEMGLGIRLY